MTTTAQDTVAAQVAALRSSADALDAIDWTGGPPPPPPPPPTGAADGYNPDNGPGGTQQPSGIDLAPAIGSWRGAPLTAYNVFQYGHKSAAMFVDSYSKPGWTPFRTVPILNHLGAMPILTIPGSVGDEAKAGPDIPYASVAAGVLDTEHKGNAAFLAAQGDWRTRLALRIARECDTHGPWFYGDAPADRAAFAAALAHLFNAIYAPGLPTSDLIVCVTKRADDTIWPQAVPLSAVPRDRLVLSIDAYLNKPSIDTAQGFKDNWIRFVQPKVDWALKNGLRVAFSEYAITEVDQPGNLQRLLDYSDALDKAGHLHHRHYFGTGDRHQLFGQTPFPKSAAAYVEWMRGH